MWQAVLQNKFIGYGFWVLLQYKIVKIMMLLHIACEAVDDSF